MTSLAEVLTSAALSKRPQRLCERSTKHLRHHIRLDSGQADKCRSAGIFLKLLQQPAPTRKRLLDLRTAFLNSYHCCSGLRASSERASGRWLSL